MGIRGRQTDGGRGRCMPELIGSLDSRRRPLMRVQVEGKDDLLSIIDTAFTGELLVDEDIAQSWGVVVLDVNAQIELGDGSRCEVQQGLLTVVWFGRNHDATVQVVRRATGQSQHRPRRDGEPVALLGTELIAPGSLNVNFTSGVVTIEELAPGQV